MEPVGKLLSDKGIAFKVSGRDYVIKCLNPDHEDSNPSLRVDRTNGMFNCFACGYKGNLFKLYDENPPITSIKMAKLKEKLVELRQQADLEMIEGAYPIRVPFRGISVETLTKFEAFATSTIPILEDRIVFPIRNIAGRIRVFIARHTMSDANPKYVFFPGHIRPGCFPERVNTDLNYIVIVEGIFDMLNLHDKGMDNVVCVFGTQTLKSDIRNKLLVYKTQGINKIYIAFDGDHAGATAAVELVPLLEEEGFKVDLIIIPEDEDPGSLTQEQVNTIKEYIK